jgi:hypothetical protein
VNYFPTITRDSVENLSDAQKRLILHDTVIARMERVETLSMQTDSDGHLDYATGGGQFLTDPQFLEAKRVANLVRKS